MEERGRERMTQDQGKHQSLQLLVCGGVIYVPRGLCSSSQSGCVYTLSRLISLHAYSYWHQMFYGISISSILGSPLQLAHHIQSFMPWPFRTPVQTILPCYLSLSLKAFWNRAISHHEPVTLCISETPE